MVISLAKHYAKLDTLLLTVWVQQGIGIGYVQGTGNNSSEGSFGWSHPQRPGVPAELYIVEVAILEDSLLP